MMPVEAEDIKEMLARVEAREEKARRELEQAEGKQERDEIRERIEALEARNSELETQLAGAQRAQEAAADDDDPEGEADDDDPPAKRRMRRGRKHGMVYQDRKGEAGYVYQGDDEPDLVPLDDDEAATG